MHGREGLFARSAGDGVKVDFGMQADWCRVNGSPCQGQETTEISPVGCGKCLVGVAPRTNGIMHEAAIGLPARCICTRPGVCPPSCEWRNCRGAVGYQPTLGIDTCLPTIRASTILEEVGLDGWKLRGRRSRAAEGHVEGIGYDPHDTSGLMPLCGYSVDSTPASGQASKSFSCPEYTIPISSF